MRTRPTPLQQTLRKRRAAERDAPRASGPPVTRLARRATRGQGTASRAPGYAVPSSAAVPPVGDRESQALRAITPTTQATAGIEPAAAWPPVRGKSQAIEHNRALRKVAGAARTEFACWQPGCARPAGSRNERLCLAPRPDGQHGHAVPVLQRPVGALACRHASAIVYPGAARTGGGTSPRPPRAVCCAGLQRFALLAPCSQPSLPSAPASGGSPKFNGNPATVGESSHRLPREHSAVLAASRVRASPRACRAPLTRLRLGADGEGQTALASRAGHITKGQHHETQEPPYPGTAGRVR